MPLDSAVRGVCVGAIAALALALPASSSAAVTLGAVDEIQSGGQSCVGQRTYVQSTQGATVYSAPFDGVITSWTYDQARGQAKLKIARPLGGNNFTIVSQDGPYTGSGIGTHPVRLPVRLGDTLALYLYSANPYCFGGEAGASALFVGGDPGPGASVSVAGSANTQRLAVRAVLEPDADDDGYGDDTQDGCPTDGGVHGPCAVANVAPDTTIDSGPKKRSKSKQAKFTFSSNEMGSTFECSVDSEPFKPCSSPYTVKAREAGGHGLLVRARDAAGLADPVEASYSWKVVKKKGKKK